MRQLIFISAHGLGLAPVDGINRTIDLLPGLKSHPSLEEIILAVDIDPAAGQDVQFLSALPEWRTLDEELDIAVTSIPTFRRLFVIVHIQFFGPPGSEGFQDTHPELIPDAVQRAMPRFFGRKMLAVQGENVRPLSTLFPSLTPELISSLVFF